MTPNRKTRRRQKANAERTIQKGTPFGRIMFKEFITEFEPPRIIYLHPGRGIVDRVLTDELLGRLAA